METNRLVFEAIATRKCIDAVYNRMAVTLAPHILYTRHDELFIDAVTLERDGQPPRELKLGTFKLVGLKDLALTERAFEPNTALFNKGEEKYADSTLFTVEMP
jgi:hypothetical protein